MKRRTFLPGLAVGSAGWLACQRSTRKRIGVVPKAVAHVFWQSVHAGAAAAARTADVDIDWKGPAQETDFSRQIEIVDSFINSRVDGIVLAPTEATSLVSVVERAMRGGIPVAIFDSALNSDQYVSFVATDNYGAGQMAARELGQLLGGEGDIAMIKMVPGSASTMERDKGFEDVLASEWPGIRVVAQQYCMSDRAKALAITENILTAQPNLKGLFATAEASTIGAAQAVKSRGLGGKIRFVAFDCSETIEEDLRAGNIDALVVQDPYRIGRMAVEAVVASINGQTPEKQIPLPATLVTVDDLSRPEIDKLLHPNLEADLG